MTTTIKDHLQRSFALLDSLLTTAQREEEIFGWDDPAAAARRDHAKAVLAIELEDLLMDSQIFWAEFAESEVPHLGGWPKWAEVDGEWRQIGWTE